MRRRRIKRAAPTELIIERKVESPGEAILPQTNALAC